MLSPRSLRILVADDHAMIRKGLKVLLSSSPGWEVCAEAATGREAVDKAEEQRPDIVVMDVCMPELNGLEATRRIRKRLPSTQVAILSQHCTEQLVREIVGSGARAYVLKSDADTDLLMAVEALANRQAFFTSAAAQILAEGFINRPPAADAATSAAAILSTREREVLQLLAEGKSSKEVAWTLGISIKTAETHRGHIYGKLKIHSISELVRYAVKNYIVEP
jgi:DNA-binding NarL/FixJ family response regulator